MGMITSLISGLPSRDTCTQGPASMDIMPISPRIRAFWRLAAHHTPTTEAAAAGLVGRAPLRVRWSMGT